MENYKKGQGAVEFFLIAGFILLATSVLLTQSDTQIRGSTALNNVIVARSALDLETSTLKYVYLSGNNTKITNTVFIPVGGQCFYVDVGANFLYCIVPGASARVISDSLTTPIPSIAPNCNRAGWVSIVTENKGGVLTVKCP